jgi:mono/diheme cytochrome c family protein
MSRAPKTTQVEHSERRLAGPRILLALGASAATALAGLTALAVIETGAFNTTAIAPHSALVAWATHTTMIRSVQREALRVRPPAGFSPQQVLTGLHQYDADCVICHGAPAVARAQWVDGMTPSPPYLMDAARQWSASELFLIIKNGVKMTGMPAWGTTRSDAQVWSLVAFLEAEPSISPRDYARMRGVQVVRDSSNVGSLQLDVQASHGRYTGP